MQDPVYRRALERAAQVCGGPEALAARLGVTPADVRMWLEGFESCPTPVFLSVVDLLVGSGEAPPPRSPDGPRKRRPSS
jgi:hypothetical protein